MGIPMHSVIVTGASRGIGAAVSGLLAGVGSSVAMVARSVGPLEDLARAIRNNGGQAVAIAADISNPDACRRSVETVMDLWGRIDTLINNAGTFTPMATIAASDPVQWQTIMATNLMGPYYLTHYALDSLRQNSGRVINVSSGASETAIVAASAYCTAKAGLNHFSRVLAAEEPDIVSVAVRPGVVDTQMQAAIRRDGPALMPAEQMNYYRRIHRDGLLEPPVVPARSIAWLARHAPPEFSGGYYSYDDPDIMTPAARLFGHLPAQSPADG